MPKPNPGKFVAIVEIYRAGGVRKIAKTMAVVGKKPGSGETRIRWEVKNSTTEAVTFDMVDWRPTNPFSGSQPARNVPAGQTVQVMRSITNTADRGTYSYVIKINSTKYPQDDPWVIIF